MSRLLIALCFGPCAFAALAQPGVRGVLPEPPRDERRQGLREVLRSPRPVPDLATASVEDAQPPRHLSPQERAELREVLRREQLDQRRARP